jgi:hypothetical protein
MSPKITRRSALPRLALAASAPLAVAAGLRCTPALAEDKPVLQGYGQCSACACPGYSGSQNVCQNCGHNYPTHW